jgi:hypothetical protein
MSRIVLDPEAEREHKRDLSPSLRVLILIVALVLAIGLLELLHRGTTAYIFSLITTVVMAVWDMFRNIAAAFRDFIDWVNHQRS